MRRTPLLLAFLFAALPARAWVAVLPGAVEGLGQAPAVFSSTVYLSNLEPQEAAVTFRLIPYAGRPAPLSATRTIPARGSLVLEHALKALFDIDADAGALLVDSDRPLAGSLVTANVANPAATYGVALTPVTDGGLLRAVDVGHAPWVTQGGGFRTNVAAVLVDPGSSVVVAVYDADGALVGQREISSEVPVSWQVPVTDLIGPRDLLVGRVEYRFTRGRGTGYVAVNDNVTGDGIAVQAPREPSSDQLLDGVAKTAGANGTFWRTDARVFNPNGYPISLTVEPIGFPSAPTLPLSVAARAILDLPDVLSRFGVSPPAAGALRFRSSQKFLVFGQTQNVDPTGQRPGTFAASQAPIHVPGQLLARGQTGTFSGVEQSSRFRSNLALLATEDGAAGTLSLRGPGSEVLGTASFTLPANQWQQRSVSDWFPGVTFAGTARVDASLSSGRLDGYLSRIDNATGDPVVVAVAVPPVTVSDVSLLSFTQRPDPIRSANGGSLFVTLQNNGPDATEGPLELTINVTVSQGGSKLVVSSLAGESAPDWILVSGTYGVSQSVRLRRRTYLPVGSHDDCRGGRPGRGRGRHRWLLPRDSRGRFGQERFQHREQRADAHRRHEPLTCDEPRASPAPSRSWRPSRFPPGPSSSPRRSRRSR